MKPLIIPTMLVKTAREAKQRLQLYGDAAAWIQWDIADGSLTPHTSWRDVETIKDWDIFPRIELHLMTKHPEPIIRAWRGVKQMKRVIWHIEAPIDHAKLIQRCRRWNLEIGLAIAPGTPIAALVPFLRQVDCVLVMGIIPGENGAPFVPASMKTITDLKKLLPALTLAFDGGIKSHNLLRLQRAGITRFDIGSALFQAADPLRTLAQFQKRIDASAKLRSRKSAK